MPRRASARRPGSPRGAGGRRRRRGGAGGRGAPQGATRGAAPPHRFEQLAVTRPPGLVHRFFTTQRHIAGLFAGALVARVREERAAGRAGGARALLRRALAMMVRPFVRRDLVNEPFPVQFRRRLELLGPTYIKLGQIMSLREDILPAAITSELRRLLNQLPVVPFAAIEEIVTRDLGRPLDSVFAWVDHEPMASASIAQIHRATTAEGDAAVLKVVKPGIRELLQRDARLLRGLSAVLELLIPRYQPRQIISEFTHYTLREVDLRREADNAETLAANFRDMPDVHFPVVYRDYSGPSVLCMEFLEGIRPDAPEARALPQEQRERLVELGATSIIRMIYGDGFFHADLHPGNLLILPGPKVGYIDLGMVGRLDGDLRRTLMLYYYSLVSGDAESAGRYLAMVARPGRGGDPAGFRREVVEISARWRRAASFERFSLGQLVLESLTRGAQYRMSFPVELVLMVKALITFEGVGHVLLPGIDIAAVSRTQIRRIFLQQFSPFLLVREGAREAPDLMDAIVKMPMLITEGLHVLEQSAHRTAQNPLAGVRGTLIAGFCLVAGAILMAFRAPWPLWGALWVIALALAGRRGE